jgi:hypothetical protein
MFKIMQKYLTKIVVILILGIIVLKNVNIIDILQWFPERLTQSFLKDFVTEEDRQRYLKCNKLRLIDRDLSNLFSMKGLESIVKMPGRSKNILSLENRDQTVTSSFSINLNSIKVNQIISPVSKSLLIQALRRHTNSETTDISEQLKQEHRDVRSQIKDRC